MERLSNLKQILTNKYYLAEFIVAFFIYFLAYLYIINLSRLIIISLFSEFIILLLIASSSLVLVAATFVLRNASKALGYAGGFFSAFFSLMGSAIVSCGCQAPILASLLYIIGLNTLEVTSFLSFFSFYNIILISIFILINLLLLYYYLGKSSQYTEKGKKKILSKVFTK